MPPRNLPFPPMEAELVTELPEGDWQYEPKWDGFRGVMENLKGELAVWSRNARPLLRYFPELREVGKLLPPDSALDGEIVIERDGVLDFNAMQLRLHPAESRIRKLSAEIPAEFIAFDVLRWKGEAVDQLPLEKRRAKLQRIGKKLPKLRAPGSTSGERVPGGQSRWTRGKELDWNPVKPKLVSEVRYDKLEKNRFRHGTRFLRFRPDKDPKDCTWREVRPPRRPDDLTVPGLLTKTR